MAGFGGKSLVYLTLFPGREVIGCSITKKGLKMKSERDVVIVEGVRTPFVKSGTQFKDVHAAELGRQALKELIIKANLDVKQVDEDVRKQQQ